jgi:hypothetical protein
VHGRPVPGAKAAPAPRRPRLLPHARRQYEAPTGCSPTAPPRRHLPSRRCRADLCSDHYGDSSAPPARCQDSRAHRPCRHPMRNLRRRPLQS